MKINSKSNIQKLYARIAQAYDQNAFLSKHIREELLSRMDVIKIDIQNILDLGCGTGQLTPAIRKAFPKAKLHCVDNSPQMLALAKKQKPLFKKYQYLYENANSLSLDNNSIDCVISNLMLQDCLQPDEVFKEVQRVCRENAVFTFSTLGPDSFIELRTAANNADISLKPHAFGHLTDMHDIGDALLRAGMREPVLDVEVIRLQFSSFSKLFNELDLSGHLQQVFTESELSRIAQNYPKGSTESDFAVTFEVVYGQAWAGDGKTKARTPEEFQFPLENLIKRKN